MTTITKEKLVATDGPKTTDGLTTYHRFDDKENLTAIILCLEFQTVRGVK